MGGEVRGGGGLRTIPVSAVDKRFLRLIMKSGTVAVIPGRLVKHEHRLGEVRVYREGELVGRYRPKVVIWLSSPEVGLLYDDVAWNPTTREFDVTYRLTPITDIYFGDLFFSWSFVGPSSYNGRANAAGCCGIAPTENDFRR